MMRKNIVIAISTAQLLCSSISLFAADQVDIKEITLPSEVSELRKESGSVYYSPTIKGKVLVPVNFWGEIERTGLHYIPIETSLIKGLSLAGGPKASGKLDNVRLIRQTPNGVEDSYFNLAEGGDLKAYGEVLKSGDTVFVERSFFFENRAYYTSLIGVVATILSSVLLYREIRSRP